MYEKILATICTASVTLGVIWFVCRRGSDRRSGDGTGTDSRRVGDDIARAETENQRLADEERRTRESIERAEAAIGKSRELIDGAGEAAERSQKLVQKAKHILSSAKRTD